MRRLGLSLLAVVLIVSSAHLAIAKGAKKGPEKIKGPAPVAKSAEINEFKGEFKWGMAPQAVIEKINLKIDNNSTERVPKFGTDPSRSHHLRGAIKVAKHRV